MSSPKIVICISETPETAKYMRSFYADMLDNQHLPIEVKDHAAEYIKRYDERNADSDLPRIKD